MVYPAHKPTAVTRERVQTLSSVGLDLDRIAGRVGISTKTLIKHYKKEIEDGKPELAEFILGELRRAARSKKITMPKMVALMFLGKAHLGWRDNHQSVRHETADGSPPGGVTDNSVHLYKVELPDNGRDPQLTAKHLLPMKMIEAVAVPVPRD